MEELSQQQVCQGSRDPFAVMRDVFDKPDHPGRVRGLGLGAVATRITTNSCGSSSVNSRYTGRSSTDAVAARDREMYLQRRVEQLEQQQTSMTQQFEEDTTHMRADWER